MPTGSSYVSALSEPAQAILLLAGTLCYALGGLLCLGSAWRRRRNVASEAKKLESHASPPNAEAQKVASIIESLAVCSAWHASMSKVGLAVCVFAQGCPQYAGERLWSMQRRYAQGRKPHQPCQVQTRVRYTIVADETSV